jgi:hypothetical protein
MLDVAVEEVVVARSRGYQVVFTPKTVLVFTVNENIAMR